MMALMKMLFLLFLPALVWSADGHKAKALYNSLDPKSISQHLALYELYPETPQGKLALSHACKLLGIEQNLSLPLSQVASAIDALISIVNKEPGREIPLLDDQSLNAIEKLASHLANRKLKGYGVNTEEETLALQPSEIDLARSLFLTQMDDKQKIRSYEAMIDLMAMQILAVTPMDAPPKEKLKTINTFIFEELGFRFPPQSLSTKEIDLYTFLPSVLDSRRGVCMGVSILYLCLAQRLNLPLETITPPGHIFVRYRDGDEIINIETTARGVNVESEMYLGIETRALQQRDIKEVIGLAHVNQAAVFWHREENQKALEAYQVAKKYLPQICSSMNLSPSTSSSSAKRKKE